MEAKLFVRNRSVAIAQVAGGAETFGSWLGWALRGGIQ